MSYNLWETNRKKNITLNLGIFLTQDGILKDFEQKFIFIAWFCVGVPKFAFNPIKFNYKLRTQIWNNNKIDVD